MTEPRRLGDLTCVEADDLAPAFVLGALEAAEADAVRAHLAACPESHEAFAAFGGIAGYLAELAEPIEPPAGARDRLMAAVAADLAPTERLVAIEVERARRRPSLPRFVLAAAAILLVIALGASNIALRGQLDAAGTQARLLRDAIAAAGQPGARVASVTGTDAQPGASGFVVVPADGNGYLAVGGLAVPPSGQTYEAWTIGADGVPVPAGLSSPQDGLAVLVLPPSAAAEVIALTLEPVGGSQTPTMPIQAAGKLGS